LLKEKNLVGLASPREEEREGEEGAYFLLIIEKGRRVGKSSLGRGKSRRGKTLVIG